MSRSILGIDIGSIAVAITEVSPEGILIRSDYAFHEGYLKETLCNLLKNINPAGIRGIAVTGEPGRLPAIESVYDSRVSYIKAAQKIYGTIGSLLIVGGEKFGLISFDQEGEYLNYRSNTSCAAGTGSFLDQQSRRLNLLDIKEFSRIALQNQGGIPKIASRCSVFAKTDLIHVQQEGYQLEEICDGLCAGLARNITDTLLNNESPAEPLIMAGGVSLNEAVIKHVSDITELPVITDGNGHLYGAYGAALQYLEDNYSGNEEKIDSWDDLFKRDEINHSYHYPPLELKLSKYPDFSSQNSYEYLSAFRASLPVEVDIYREFIDSDEYSVYIGIDIGSTSTKAVIISESGEVITGLYTRTSGRPVEAVQCLMEAIEDIEKQNQISFAVRGCGTTGSGRKFIGKIIGADEALDEITAHARAAFELDPRTDTIIEIGGQDAKFTTLKNGMVTFSIMNNVCAAGTGSFIEEQAKKIGCPLQDYSERAMHTASPLSSDRCTVFMERDLNHYMNEGYDIDEVLASVLHSVRENYLSKVAIEKNIGDYIFFQGATAKNKALVAAFEQRLNKQIMVSPFCHLTGALGVALNLKDNYLEKTKFRGTGIYREAIPVRTEVCELCTNHCKIRIASVAEDTVAFGFLCGRDYEETKFIKTEGSGFNLLRERKKISKPANKEKKKNEGNSFRIGIPAALHIYEEINLWEKFFTLLGMEVVSSEGRNEAMREGKKLAGAEFCAPVTELHGHVNYLLENSDYVFLPVYIEENIKGAKLPRERRHYCYYTQFSPAVVAGALKEKDRARILKPVVKSLGGEKRLLKELYSMISNLPGCKKTFRDIKSAYQHAQRQEKEVNNNLLSLYQKNRKTEDINVIFLGRPYNVLSPTMNKGIPDIFDRMGITCFHQDMIKDKNDSSEEIAGLLEAFHWNYAAKILETAETVAGTPGLYPVFITSFKCTPDSYAVEYLKKIMSVHEKPYLILQLDEHDSSIGYETRIEAGIRSFTNHFQKESDSGENKVNYATLNPKVGRSAEMFKGKTLLLPRWDDYVGTLMTAVLQHEGIDARLVEETPGSIQRSLSQNTGQCIPLHIMVQNTVDYIRKQNLDPSDVVMWNIDSRLSCNLGIFPYYMKNLYEDMGNGFENLEVYAGVWPFLIYQ